MLIYAGQDGSCDGEAPAGGGEGVAGCGVAPGGWLLVMGREGGGSAVVSRSSSRTRFYYRTNPIGDIPYSLTPFVWLDRDITESCGLA